jgi:hypothetical protein
MLAGLFCYLRPMDKNRKRAYRYLLYHFLITISRPPRGDSPAEKLTDEQRRRYINYAGPVAYLLHNLALLGADDDDFYEFNEDEFWNGFDDFSQRCPDVDVSHFRRVFESELLRYSGN